MIFGRSLGAAVAAEMANRFDSRAVILETPFVSIREMAKSSFPALADRAAAPDAKYDNLEKIGKIKVPLLVLHGDHDEIIPFEHGKRVFAAARQPEEISIRSAAPATTIPTLSAANAYYERLRELYRNLRQRSS